ncbi:MAG: hypothetical protein Q8L13_19235 [Bradyrhizobium sp.]|nr:hypothetical protein [Bradyrhizobium sp.]
MNTFVALPIASAVPTAAPAMPPASAKPNPDAALFALIDEFVAADKKYRELRSAVDRMEDAFRHPEPRGKMPDVLRWRRSDKKLGLPMPYICPAFPKPIWDREIHVCSLRGKKWLRSERVLIKDHPTKGMFYSRMWMVTPSKAARTRADEIIAAFDEWNPGGRGDAPPPRGFKKLQRECDRADKVASKLQDQVCGWRATTMEGMLAKVRAAHATLWCKPDKVFDVSTDNISGCAEEMAESIFRDLQSMAMAEASLIPSA